MSTHAHTVWQIDEERQYPCENRVVLSVLNRENPVVHMGIEDTHITSTKIRNYLAS